MVLVFIACAELDKNNKKNSSLLDLKSLDFKSLDFGSNHTLESWNKLRDLRIVCIRVANRHKRKMNTSICVKQ